MSPQTLLLPVGPLMLSCVPGHCLWIKAGDSCSMLIQVQILVFALQLMDSH